MIRSYKELKYRCDETIYIDTIIALSLYIYYLAFVVNSNDININNAILARLPIKNLVY